MSYYFRSVCIYVVRYVYLPSVLSLVISLFLSFWISLVLYLFSYFVMSFSLSWLCLSFVSDSVRSFFLSVCSFVRSLVI